jgi:hypothetical protein
MAIVFATIFASVICGLVKLLKNWQVFEWIVAIGVGAVLLFWAICICTNNIGYFKVKPKKWRSVVMLALGMLFVYVLRATGGAEALVVVTWWSLYIIAGGVLTIRWAYKNNYQLILGMSIVETIFSSFFLFLSLVV